MTKNEQFDKQLEEMVNIKQETIFLSEDTKVLKETTNKFSSKIIEQENHISSLTPHFEELFENMIVCNRFDRKVEAAKSKIEATIEMKLDYIKTYHMKTINKTIQLFGV